MTFIPGAWSEEHVQNVVRYFGQDVPVTGTVVYVDETKRWFRVEYQVGNAVMHECLWTE